MARMENVSSWKEKSVSAFVLIQQANTPRSHQGVGITSSYKHAIRRLGNMFYLLTLADIQAFPLLSSPCFSLFLLCRSIGSSNGCFPELMSVVDSAAAPLLLKMILMEPRK